MGGLHLWVCRPEAFEVDSQIRNDYIRFQKGWHKKGVAASGKTTGGPLFVEYSHESKASYLIRRYVMETCRSFHHPIWILSNPGGCFFFTCRTPFKLWSKVWGSFTTSFPTSPLVSKVEWLGLARGTGKTRVLVGSQGFGGGVVSGSFQPQGMGFKSNLLGWKHQNYKLTGRSRHHP